MTPPIAQPGFAPAGGAPLLQVALAASASLLAFVPLAVVVLRERTGRPTLVGRLADVAGSLFGAPRWLALPMLVQVAALAAAGLGVYWDVPWHADLGRDEGPLANPAHYLILAGLLGVFASGVLAAALATRELPARTVRMGRGWRVPAGAVVIMTSGLIALSGFPLDDLWHRLFGQDVTEWGPTHVLMIGGAVVSLLGTMLLVAEATQVRGRRTTALRYTQLRLAALWLVGVSVFLMEYEVGVPQFPMVAHPVLLAIAATWALCYARATFGPGGAILAVALYLAVRVLFLVITGSLLGRTAAHFSLYVVPALLVELLPLLVPVVRRTLFGAIAGLLIGSVGMLAEAAWTHVFFPLPWPSQPDELWRLIGYGTLAGLGAGLVAGWQLSRLDDVSRIDDVSRLDEGGRSRESRAVTPRLGLLGAALVVLAMVLTVPRDGDQRLAGELTLQHVDAGNALVTVRLDDPDAAQRAVWFHALAWQGGGRVLAPMERVDAGLYRTTRPMPVHGTWKTLVRLHLPDDYLVALPVYLPADPAIPAGETPAASGVTRSFEPELHILQREAKRGLPGWSWALGYGAVFGISALALAAVAALYTKAASPGRRREPAGPLRSSDPART